MGNQPSSPTPVPPALALPPPPPPCDLECQKQKDLAKLKQAFDSAQPDTEEYERAKIAYYTLKNGAGWLVTEKQRIAKQDVEPTTQAYQQEFHALKGEIQSQSVFTNLANALKAQEGADRETNRFLQRQLEQEKDRARVTDRLNELGTSTQSSWYVYVSWIVDALIVVLACVVAYKGYIRFRAPQPVLSTPM